MAKFLNFTLKIIYIFAFVLAILLGWHIYNAKYAFYVDYDEFSMVLGDSYTIEVTPRYYQYFDVGNYILEDDSGLVEIDGLNISAINEGNTTLIIKSKERYNFKKIKLSIIDPTISTIATDDEIFVDMDDDKAITAKLNGANIKSNLKYEVENSDVATIDEYGKIKAIAEGSTQVKVSYSDNVYTYTNITVVNDSSDISRSEQVISELSENVLPRSVKLSKPSISLYPNDNDELTASINPIDVTDKSISWSSSNNSIASVENGVVHAHAIGVVTITATTSNGKKATCNVNVISRPIDVESVKLLQDNITLSPNNKITLGYIIEPSSASDKSVTWSTNNSSVVTVDNGVVKAKKAGNAVVTITTKNGKTSTCNVIVMKGTIDASGISLEQSSVNVNVNENITLHATVSPSDATNKIVSWSSNNNSVAVVSQDGVITGKKEGTATITAKTVNGKTSTCNVKVIKPIISVQSVGLNTNSISLYVGDTSMLSLTINPSNANNKNIVWSSSNGNIVSVQNGKIVALNPGNAVITATVDGKSASCVVNVTKKVVQLIRGSMYNNGFLHYYEGYDGTNYEYNDRVRNNCNNADSIYKPQNYTLYPANNAPIFQECHYEGSTKVYTAEVNGNNDKLVKVSPNDEVQLDISTYGKKYPATGNSWPHLLISGRTGTNGLGVLEHFNSRLQDGLTGLNESDRSYYYFSNDNQIDLSLDVKLNKYDKGKSINGVQAFQFLFYLEVYCDNACGGSQKLYWLGFNLLDDRGYFYYGNEGEAHVDEKTQSLVALLPTEGIYTNGSIYNKSNNSLVYNQWKHVQINLSQRINELLVQIHNQGYTNVKSSDLRYGGFNIGYEVHGEYWNSMSFKNLKLTSIKK